VFRCGSGQLNQNPMKMLFVSVNASRAWWLNSRPQPRLALVAGLQTRNLVGVLLDQVGDPP
jgi:hypothetical protein